MDLIISDVDGRLWDFSLLEMRKRAKDKIARDEPLLTIGPPMCTNFSSAMDIHWGRMSDEEKENRLIAARLHLNFCMELYELQHQAWKHLPHEYPQAAASWKELGILRISSMKGVIETVCHKCRFGMKQKDATGESLTLKLACSMTSSVCIVDRVNLLRTKAHRHIKLEGRRSEEAQLHPKPLCEAICKGSVMHKKMDAVGLCMVCDSPSNINLQDAQHSAKDLHEGDEGVQAWDDVTGKDLNPEVVRIA